jgi:hypothetical protein
LVLNGSQQEILNKIIKAVTNPTTLHTIDEQRIACLFYDLVKQNRQSDLDDIDPISESLPSDYPDYTRNRIREIANVIELLAHCHEV